MTPLLGTEAVPVPPPSYHRSVASSLHLDALTLVRRLDLLAICGMAVQGAQRRCPPPLPAGPGGRPRTYTDASVLLLAVLRTLWRLSYEEVHDWLIAWPALALACGFALRADGVPQVLSTSQQSKRLHALGAPPAETLLLLLVRLALHRGLTRARDVIIDSAPILAWQRQDADAALGHAPAHHARRLLRGYRVHTLLCRATGLPLLYLLAPANSHDAPFARPLLMLATRLLALRPRIVRLDAAYWGNGLITWLHTYLGAVAVIPWNPKRQRQRDALPPTWTADELGKRSSIERFFARVMGFFRLQRPPVVGWSQVACRVALTYAATWIIALAATDAGRPDLLRSPRRVLAHYWEGDGL